VAIALATKPQAIPLLLPLAAWFWATGGIREVVRATAIGLVTTIVLWLPFIPAGGLLGYLGNLGTYQSDTFNVLSLRAWNPWWLLQEVAANGNFIADDIAFLGPVTLRHVGYALTGLLSLIIAGRILRDPRPDTLIVGLAASVLAFFTFMTQMHERYAYAAIVLLLLLVTDARIRWLWIPFAAIFTLNLVAAVPVTPELSAMLPVSGVLGVAGSLAMLALTALSFVRMYARNPAARSTWAS
jgi:Gpi18-like mannosyltransferase